MKNAYINNSIKPLGPSRSVEVGFPDHLNVGDWMEQGGKPRKEGDAEAGLGEVLCFDTTMSVLSISVDKAFLIYEG